MTVVRTAPDGGRVTVSVPPQLGALTWYAVTRLSGPRLARGFRIAPVGQHEVVPRRILPGARRTVFRRRGHDVLLYEARDRRDSCLVWVGPHHEAVTWFGGPAPRADVLGRLVGTVCFADGERGARLVPEAGSAVRQYGSTVVGWGSRAVVMLRSARDGGALLPDWRGHPVGDAEVWRAPLDAGEADEADGGWRYVLANDTAVTELIIRPDGPRDDDVGAALTGLRTSWLT